VWGGPKTEPFTVNKWSLSSRAFGYVQSDGSMPLMHRAAMSSAGQSRARRWKVRITASASMASRGDGIACMTRLRQAEHGQNTHGPVGSPYLCGSIVVSPDLGSLPCTALSRRGGDVFRSRAIREVFAEVRRGPHAPLLRRRSDEAAPKGMNDPTMTPLSGAPAPTPSSRLTADSVRERASGRSETTGDQRFL